jgi:antirestriction protein ArdC
MSYVHDQVTTKILERLEQGVVPWRRRWQVTGSAGMPRNYKSDRPYNGINVILLWLTELEHGFRDKRWLTFNQVKAIGGSVKGESATRIIFAGQGKKQRDDGEEETYTCVKFYNVFNTEQIEGLTVEPEAETEPVEVKLTNVQAFVEAQAVPIIHGGNRAFYSPNRDVITLPPQASFFDEEAYWGTTLHELAHATGHRSRLGRELGKRGSPEYAFEELIAELASCFVGAELGITPTFEDSASYLSHWCELLGKSKTAIFQAAREATRVAAYLRDQAIPLAVAA